MKLISAIALFFALIPGMAMAQQDCSGSVTQLKKDCSMAVSEASTQLGEGSGAINSGGATLAANAQQNIANFTAAIGRCGDPDDSSNQVSSSDLKQCRQQCGQAFQAAQALPTPQNQLLSDKINGNLSDCEQSIRSSVGQAKTAISQNETYQTRSLATCTSSSGSDCMIDKSSSITNDAKVQNVNSTDIHYTNPDGTGGVMNVTGQNWVHINDAADTLRAKGATIGAITASPL